jgi:hypothetical protein
MTPPLPWKAVSGAGVSAAAALGTLAVAAIRLVGESVTAASIGSAAGRAP